MSGNEISGEVNLQETSVVAESVDIAVPSEMMSLNAESANGDSNLSNLCSAAVLSFDKDPETPEWAKNLLRIFQGLVN